ncbi:linoleate 13S-lipoxygenase 3-1, chloroplastic-like [Selaginella moellendorffii]|uniref:linoleate 13S-lipoxygenase 3-1, chloroplastic-like n=1 Tax=Selaginella moellendorffii TaxID=88036 RepID=UPI000D1C8B1C|nr:linoleate 13S-lipoxygenase 3-1, chloroplastic-like [Selaginella moellendorffii]|eukprot:XP_024542113.1 linoleate 13S-lipoxygenase 3-1, chloroplastic-like [Selaginella moellendorffii]
MASLALTGSISASYLPSSKETLCGDHSEFAFSAKTRSRSNLPSLRLTRGVVPVKNTLKSADVAEQAVADRVSRSKPVTLRAIVTIKKRPDNKVTDIFRKGLDFFVQDPLGEDIVLQLVSTEVDPSSGLGRRSKNTTLRKVSTGEHTVEYAGEFIIEDQFGKPGAILVANRHKAEFFLETISLQGLKTGLISFSCYSWVHSQENEVSQRVFFSNEAYLPSSTPRGLKDIRASELKTLQGDGTDMRKPWERIYDYDVYNDLGNPDKEKKLARPVAGGAVPYPRRCRTGRPPTKSDPRAEVRLAVTSKNYVPRDEDFEQVKTEAFSSGRLRAIVHRLVPTIITHFTATPDEFDTLTDIDRLFYEGIRLQTELAENDRTFWDIVPEQIRQLINADKISNAIKYPLPPLLAKDKYAWTRDSEFGRQVLAGLNPLMIERLKAFPPTSSMDTGICGTLGSAFEAAELEKHLEGLTVEEAIKAEKLFIIDYHDVFMPLINRINSLKGRKNYATRTILYLDSANLLMPVGIELCLPVSKDKPNGSKRAFYPTKDATGFWIWQLCKTHVRSNHSAYHQVVSHWLQTHACIEPYVIATNRQLSAMHPVAKLLDPHLRYTMQINATARQTLISAGGVIEQCFTPGKFILELSAAGYEKWRFDKQGLPADLLERGMAVEDKNSPDGLRLVLEDYPYAADGLLVWSALKSWVTSYLSVYYDSPDSITSDTELQAWWNEIKTKGHPDKAEGWPSLNNKQDLVEILTSIMWVASGHHAAVNFGQFLYSGYVLNLPSLTRKLIPEKDDPEYKELLQNPQGFLLATLPNQTQATTVMAVLELLSTHHPDEEYLGQRVQKYWTGDERVLEGSNEFEERIAEVQEIIEKRNNDPKLMHRHGAGVPAYELLLPTSGPGITARGIPNSVSI